MKTISRLLISGCVLLALLAGCEKLKLKKAPEAKRADSQTIATVNGEPVTAKDFKRELAIRAKQDPAFVVTPQTLNEQLDLMINRRLLIQEATRRKLPERERFVTTIRNFWEQTLVKELMDELTKEFEEDVFVTEAEIQDYYARLGAKVTFQIVRRPDKAAIDELVGKLQKNEPVAWDQKIGPAGFEELTAGALMAVFTLPVGEARVFQEGGVYYLVQVAAQETVSQPPLEQIREQLKTQIAQRKHRAQFEQWLKDLKSKAAIQVHTERLREEK